MRKDLPCLWFLFLAVDLGLLVRSRTATEHTSRHRSTILLARTEKEAFEDINVMELVSCGNWALLSVTLWAVRCTTWETSGGGRCKMGESQAFLPSLWILREDYFGGDAIRDLLLAEVQSQNAGVRASAATWGKISAGSTQDGELLCALLIEHGAISRPLDKVELRKNCVYMRGQVLAETEMRPGDGIGVALQGLRAGQSVLQGGPNRAIFDAAVVQKRRYVHSASSATSSNLACILVHLLPH